ncbi:MAG: hypothetical protein GY847_42100 [Proteobacteria bacterium]|nr:hypothetical protein [Pseudomonadota bacterium]
MEKPVREALEKHFPVSEVRQRKGNFGKKITFVEANAIIERLNECFEQNWNFTVVEHMTLDTGEVLVIGRLAAFGVTKEAFGKSSPAISKESGEMISLADAYKSAATDSLKKAATLLGVGTYLYSDEYQGEDRPSRLVPRPNRPNVESVNNATQKQLAAINSIARNLGISQEAVNNRCKIQFKTNTENLSKRDASTFISMLTQEQRGAA